MSNSTNPRYGTVDRQYATRLATTGPEHDGPIWMVNLMNYREVARYADGRESSISGREADDLYAPIDTLTEIGAKPVFFGDVEQQLLGRAPIWDRVAVVKYPTRRSFIDMQSRPKFQESHKHKDAGRVAGWFAVEGTIIGDGRVWHQVRFNQFPGRRAFMAVVTGLVRLEPQKNHREKAIADTYTMIVRASIDALAESTSG
jgi:hypothetical protein